jgi:hypothetical protein
VKVQNFCGFMKGFELEKSCDAPLTHLVLLSDEQNSLWGGRGRHVHQTLNSTRDSPFHEKIGSYELGVSKFLHIKFALE